MASNRKHRTRIHLMQRLGRLRQRDSQAEDRLWDSMAPVGREFGSPDFERLMEDDHRLRQGAFDPTARLLVADADDRDGLIVFFSIAKRWALSLREQAALLGVDPVQLSDLGSNPCSAPLPPETKARLGYICDIDDSLQILLPIPERANAWVKQPNAAPLFKGASALGFMLHGQLSDLADVAGYLRAMRGGDFS